MTEHTEELVEIVARAIAMVMKDDPDNWDFYEPEADAAIDAYESAPQTAAELSRVKEMNEELVEVLGELLEVANLRGDNQLPHPVQDPLEWSARMQEAWEEAEATLSKHKAEGDSSDG